VNSTLADAWKLVNWIVDSRNLVKRSLDSEPEFSPEHSTDSDHVHVIRQRTSATQSPRNSVDRNSEILESHRARGARCDSLAGHPPDYNGWVRLIARPPPGCVATVAGKTRANPGVPRPDPAIDWEFPGNRAGDRRSPIPPNGTNSGLTAGGGSCCGIAASCKTSVASGAARVADTEIPSC
jgi:hypothetical protein